MDWKSRKSSAVTLKGSSRESSVYRRCLPQLGSCKLQKRDLLSCPYKYGKGCVRRAFCSHNPLSIFLGMLVSLRGGKPSTMVDRRKEGKGGRAVKALAFSRIFVHFMPSFGKRLLSAHKTPLNSSTELRKKLISSTLIRPSRNFQQDQKRIFS